MYSLWIVFYSFLPLVLTHNSRQNFTNYHFNYLKNQVHSHPCVELGKFYGLPIFSDEFDFFDFDKWKHELTLGGGGNWEFQFYNNNRSTSYVQDGKLFIKPILTTDYLGISDEELINKASLDIWGNSPGFQCTANGFFGCQRASNGNNVINPIMSAQLRTHHSFSFNYGKVEVKAQLPRGDWLWPAIWLLPKHYAYGGWPASGEIDILESRGNQPGYPGHGSDTISSTLHWGPDWKHNQYESTTQMYKLPQGKSFSDEFHIFTLEWTPNYIRTWVDNKHLVLNIDHTTSTMWERAQLDQSNLFNPWKDGGKNAPFDQQFSLILNLAIGGTNNYFPDYPPNKNRTKPWLNSSPTAAKDFILNKDQWYPSWQPSPPQSNQAALIIDSIHVYPYTGPN